MATKLLSFIIILGSYLISINHLPFTGFKDIHRKDTKVEVNKIKIDFSLKKHILTSDSYTSNIIVLNKTIGLSHIYPNYEDRISTYEQNVDTLVIYNQKFCIQTLLNDSINNIYPNIQKAYFFKQKERKILCVEGLFRGDVAISHLNWILIFDITNINNVFSIKNINNRIYKTDSDFFGDFDNNGIIDICLFQGDTIRVFNIQDNQFVNLKDKYLSIERVVSNQHIYCINLNKSNWFYKLKVEGCNGTKKFIFNTQKEYYY